MKLVKQRQLDDCGVAALAMVCEVRYADAMHALEVIGRKPKGSGLHNVDLINAARVLDRRLEPTMKRSRVGLIQQPDVKAVVVVLWNSKRQFLSHFVACEAGLLHDPADAMRKNIEQYLHGENARLGAALVRVR